MFNQKSRLLKCRLTVVALIAFTAILTAVAVFQSAIFEAGRVYAKDGVFIAKPIENYGMPETFNFDFTVSSATGKQPFTLSQTGVGVLGTDYANPTAIMSKINTEVGTTTSSTTIRIKFGSGASDEISFGLNEYLNLTKAGKYVLTGNLSGYVGLSASGLVAVSGAAGATKLYLNNFNLINKASWTRYNSATNANYDPLYSNVANTIGYTSYEPKGLSATGAVDVYVLGNSSVKCTNEYFFETTHSDAATKYDFLGYSSTANAHNGVGASGIGKTLSMAFTENAKSASTSAGTYTSYTAAVENLKMPLLNTAYGEGSAFRRHHGDAEAAAMISYYSGKPFDAWVKSDRTRGDGDARRNDFADIYSYANTANLGWKSATANGGAATYTISTRMPYTGAAVAFASSGSLVVDTTGEISNYGCDAVDVATGTAFFARATIQLTSTTFAYEDGTRLYVKSGEIINRYYDVNYLRTYSTTGSITDTGVELKSGLLFDLRATTNTSNAPADLLEGGTYICPASIIYLNNAATDKASRITVGKSNGTGPVIKSGVLAGNDRASDEVIRYLANPSPSPQTQLMLWQPTIMMIRGGFVGNTYVRSDLVFLGGELTSNRNSALGFNTSATTTYHTAYDVHLMGGTWKSGDYGLHGFIKNTSTGVATAVPETGQDTALRGSTIFTYGNGDQVRLSDGTDYSASGITVSAKVNYYANTTTTYGLFVGETASGSVPLFRIYGGEFNNNDNQQGTTADMFRVAATIKRDVLIYGGYFYSDCGMFIRHVNSAADVVMTGGKFEVKGSNTNTAISVGPSDGSITTTYSIYDNSGYASLSMSGAYASTWTDLNPDSYGLGSTGIVYLNGGEIIGNNNTATDGLIRLAKSNNRTAVVVGLNPRPVTDPSTTHGYDPTDKADDVTKITNKGTSPIFKIMPGITPYVTYTTYTYPVGEHPRTFGVDRTTAQSLTTYYMYAAAFGNSRLIIDRMDFEYAGYGDSFSGASIHAVPVHPTYELNYSTTTIYPKVVFTGTMSKSATESGLLGYVETGTNVVYLEDTFNDDNYNSVKHVLNMSDINTEHAINKFIINNYMGDGNGDPTTGYSDHFSLMTANSGISRTSGHTSGGIQSIEHYNDGEVNELRRNVTLSVNFFTQKGLIGGNGTTVSTEDIAYTGVTEDASFIANNKPGGYTAGTSKAFIAAGGVQSYFTYADVIADAGYSGEVFPDGHPCAGLPLLRMNGYEHLGWSYTGHITPFYSTNYNFHNTAYKKYNQTFNRIKVCASDQLWNYFDHFLVAEWKLEDPTFSDGRTVNSSGVAGVEGNGEQGSASWNLNRTYGALDETTLRADAQHASQDLINLTKTYAWQYLPVGGNVNTDWVTLAGKTESTLSGIQNVAQNGTYRVAVTVADDTQPTPMTANITYSWVVDIKPRPLTRDNIFMPTVAYDTQLHSPLEEGFFFFESKEWDSINQDWIYTPLNLVDGTGLPTTTGIDFTCNPGLNAKLSGIRAWPFYFNFFNNYSGTNVMAEFIIWGDLNIMFGNLKSASADIMDWSELVTVDPGDGGNSYMAYPALPALTGVNGYTFSHWTFQGVKIEEGSPVTVEYAHTLYAVWIMDAPAVTTKVDGVNTNELKFEFDRSMHYFAADATVGSPALGSVTLGYNWQKWLGGELNTETGLWEGGEAADEPASGLSSLPRMNVEARSHYKLTVTARDTDGLVSTTVKSVWVEVTPKAISAGDIRIPAQPYDGSGKSAYISIIHNGFYLEEGADFNIIKTPTGYPDDMIDPGTYTFEFEFIGNYKNSALDEQPTTVEGSSKNVINRDFIVFINITILFGNLKPGVAPVSAVASPITITSSSTYPALPAPVLPEGFKGYSFSHWEYNGAKVEEGDGIESIINHTLLAVWDIKTPTVSASTTSIDITYNRVNNPVTISASVDGLTVGLVFTYAWERLTYFDGDGDEQTFSGSYYYTGATNYFSNVSDSGKYRCTVTITDGTLTKIAAPVIVDVKIAKKNITDSDISSTLAVPTGTFVDSSTPVYPVISLVHGGSVLQHDIEYTWYDEETETQVLIPEAAGHEFKLIIIGKGNYEGTIEKTFAVDSFMNITFVSALSAVPSVVQYTTPFPTHYAGLPTSLDGVAGYTFVGWEWVSGDGTRVPARNGEPIPTTGSHILHAKWTLNEIVIAQANEELVEAGLIGSYRREGYSVMVVPGIQGMSSSALSEILFVYEWKRQSDGYIGGTSAMFIRTGIEDAYYTLEITAFGAAGLSRKYTITNIPVAITQKSINDSAISVYMPAKNIANSAGRVTLEYSVAFNGVLLTANTDFAIKYYDEVLEEFVTDLPADYGVGEYLFQISGINNFFESRTVMLYVTSTVTISFYTQLGSTPGAVGPNEGKYPTLPVPTGAPAGYTFVKWQYNGADLPLDNALASEDSHLLTAVWKLNEIKLSNEATVAAGTGGDYQMAGYSLTANPYVEGNPTGIIYSYEWKKDGVLFSTLQTLTVRDIAHSGVYTLTIKAIGQSGITPTADYTLSSISVAIGRLDISDTNVSVYMPAKTYTGSNVSMEYTITYGGITLVSGVDYTLEYYNGTAYTTTIPSSFGIGEYTFRFTGIGNFKESRTALFVVSTSTKISFFTAIGTAPASVDPAAGNKYPTLSNPSNIPSGYTFNGWYYNGTEIVGGDDLVVVGGSHTLTAEWSLKPITNANHSTNAAGIGASSDVFYSRQGYTLTAAPIIDGNPSNIVYTYEWKNQLTSEIKSTAAIFSVTNVSDNGMYTLTIRALGQAGTTPVSAYVLTDIVVNIKPRPISQTTITIFNKSATGSETVSLEYIITYGNVELMASEYSILYLSGEGGTATLPTEYGVGIYGFMFEGKGNFSGSVEKSFVVSDPISDNTRIHFNMILAGVSVSYIDGMTLEQLDSDGLPASADLVVEPNATKGYSFKGWTLINGTTDVITKDDLAGKIGTINLYAVWTLDEIVFKNPSAAINRGYLHNESAPLTLTVEHALLGAAGINVSYVWRWTPVGGVEGATGKYSDNAHTYIVKDVADSGLYRLTVVLRDGLGNSVEKNYVFSVEIREKEIASVTIESKTYNAFTQNPIISVKDGTYDLEPGRDYILDTQGQEFKNAKTYENITITFIGNYKNADGFVQPTYTINGYTITFSSDNLKGNATPDEKQSSETGTYGELPDYTEIAATGYMFLGWRAQGSTAIVTETTIVNGHTTLYAVWEMDELSVTEGNGISREFIAFNDLNDAPYTLTADHSIAVTGALDYYYVWYFKAAGQTSFVRIDASNAISLGLSGYTSAVLEGVYEVRHSGSYYVVVTAMDSDSLSSTAQSGEITVTISRKEMTKDDITIDSAEYSSGVIPVDGRVRIMHGTYTLVKGVDYEILPQGDEYRNAKDYTILFRFIGNYTQDNEADVVSQIYTINARLITFVNISDLTIAGVYSTEDGKYPTLPAITGVSGYKHIGWEYNGAPVVAGNALEILQDHSLRAVWKLNAPEVQGLTDIDEVFDWEDYTVTASVALGSLVIGADVEVTYSWMRLSDSVVVSTGKTMALRNVSDSGQYLLTVTVYDRRGLTGANDESNNRSVYTEEVNVQIAPKLITSDAVDMPAQIFTGTGIKPSIMVVDNGNLVEITEYEIFYDDGSGNKVHAENFDFVGVGKYTIAFEFKDNFYGEFDLEFNITRSKSIVEAWWLWVIIVAAMLVICAIICLINYYLMMKRKKYGMKRHMHSFMDDFDIQN